MYVFAQKPYIVIGSCFVNGISSGVYGPVFAMVNKTTKQQNRTLKINRVLIFRQIGGLLGSLCYFGLKQNAFHFWIGSYHINNFTLPLVS